MYLNFKCVVPTAKDLGDMILAMTKRNLLESKPEGDSWQYSHFVGFENARFLQTSEPALFCGWSMEITTFKAAMSLIMQIPEVIKLQPKFRFRPNAPVLVRDASCYWTTARYAYMLNERFVVFGGNSYTQMIQYETNRQLIGRCITPDNWWEIEDLNKPVWKTKR